MSLNGVPSHVFQVQNETVWFDANKYHEAERQYHELQALKRKKSGSQALENKGNKLSSIVATNGIKTNQVKAITASPLTAEIAEARLRLQNFLKDDLLMEDGQQVLRRVINLENERKQLRELLDISQKKLDEVFKRLTVIEAKIAEPSKVLTQQAKEDLPGKELKTTNGPAADDDIDLFGSDEETEEDIRIREERVKAYATKKAKKPTIVAKSSVVLDVKPWSDETDMKELEIAVRGIHCDGLKWGAANLVPLAYGIKKLQIVAIVEDDKVSIDWLQESIQDMEDLVQSVDIAAFNKL